MISPVTWHTRVPSFAGSRGDFHSYLGSPTVLLHTCAAPILDCLSGVDVQTADRAAEILLLISSTYRVLLIHLRIGPVSEYRSSWIGDDLGNARRTASTQLRK